MSNDDREPQHVSPELADKLMSASADDEEVANDDAVDVDDSDAGGPSVSSNGTDSRTKKKKPRLHWDEQNLLSNALEKERNPYPKIDEPKTPYHTLSGSEGGSSSGSAPQSPGSPAFISRDHLVGFDNLEQHVSRSSSADGHPRSVHIIEDAGLSSGGDSSPRSREEFEAKRKQHYKAEHPKSLGLEIDDFDEDVEDETPDIVAAREAINGAIGQNVSSVGGNVIEASGNSVAHGNMVASHLTSGTRPAANGQPGLEDEDD